MTSSDQFGKEQTSILAEPSRRKIPHYNTIIISDVHLGSKMSRAEAVLHMLKTTSFDRLILLGDIFSDLNFRRLKKEHWQFLSYIRKLSNPKRGVEVIWVEGNHDYGLAELMSHLVGIEVYQEYIWEYRGIKHLAIHGHQFDLFVVSNRFLSGLLTAFHLALQKFSFGEQRLVRFIDRFDTKWLRLSSKVRDGALAHARTRNAQRVFCGHTHEALNVEENGIEYFNSGSWTQPSSTYITIDQEGVEIREYNDDDYDRILKEPALSHSFEFEDLAG